MTTTEEEPTENDHQPAEVRNENAPTNSKIMPTEIMDIMKYLSKKSNIMFKSQQRDEPELLDAEKLKVALDVYQRNPQTFLIRFGNFLEDNHLQDFARYSIADGDEEMINMVEDYQNKLKTRQRDVKNRRYTALQNLIKEGEYFSEQEMMKRQPELYHELVGQYLSDKEKEKRDCYDVKNTTFSGILMHSLEQKQLNEIMEKARYERDDNLATSVLDPCTENDVLNDSEKESEVPLNCRQQWGNFDNESVACSSSKMQNDNSVINNKAKAEPVLDLIMADERELLRQEFISQMHEQFLSGQDKDFDYSTVDDNTQYDDLNIINQDKEDKYFDESDDSSIEGEEIRSLSKMEDDDESEDELDAFMSRLSKHHSLQKPIKN